MMESLEYRQYMIHDDAHGTGKYKYIFNQID